MTSKAGDLKRRQFANVLQSALTKDEVAAAYLSSVTQVIQADGLGLYELDFESGKVIDVKAAIGHDFLEDYELYGRIDDPVLNFVLNHKRATDSSRVSTAELWESCGARSAIAVGGYCHSMEAPLMVSGILFGTLNFSRARQDPAFSAADLISAGFVSEQLSLATERALRFEMTGRRSSALEHALERMSQAVIVTDLDSRVIFQNRNARNECDLDLGSDDEIRSTNVVASCIQEAMTQFRVDGKRIYTQSVHDPRSKRQIIVKSYRLSDRDSSAVTLLFNCADDQSRRKLPAWDVLSRREQEIAQFVSEGLTTKQIADKAFISQNTVKQHLKRAFAKTDVNNRAELVQLIWTSGKMRD